MSPNNCISYYHRGKTEHTGFETLKTTKKTVVMSSLQYEYTSIHVWIIEISCLSNEPHFLNNEVDGTISAYKKNTGEKRNSNVELKTPIL